MSTNRTEYDLVVLGGGIAGLGVAWEATLRGLKVLLLERDRFGAATSANSLRIIHGGLRYLQSLSLKRVLVSSREQYHLLKSNPNHISLLKCLMPLKGSGMRSSWPVAAALSFHSSLAHLCA